MNKGAPLGKIGWTTWYQRV